MLSLFFSPKILIAVALSGGLWYGLSQIQTAAEQFGQKITQNLQVEE